MSNASPTFSVSDGITSVGPGNDEANSVIVQADGKILVAGSSTASGNGNQDFMVVRYNSDGTLDTSFGGGDGKVKTGLGSGDDRGMVIMASGNGGFVVAGYSQVATDPGAMPPTVEYVYAAARYLADGTLDTSFGTGGILLTDLVPAAPENPPVTAVQTDGKVLVAANGGIVRFNVDGTVDPTFDVVLGWPSLPTELQVVGSVIVASGTSWLQEPIFTKIGLDGGLLDSTVINAFEASAVTSAMQPDGWALVAFSAPVNGFSAVKLAWINTAATAEENLLFDPGYGRVFAVAIPDVAGAVVKRVLVREDGGITVVGQDNLGGFLLHVGFEGQEMVNVVDLPAGFGTNAVPQEDGQTVVVGTVSVGGQSAISVLRYNVAGAVDRSFGGANTLGGTIAANERGQAVVLDADVGIYDEVLSAWDRYDGAALTLQRAGESDASDVFSGSGTLVLGPAGSDVTVDGIIIGTVTQNGSGALTIAFQLAATQALVDTAMRQIAYANTSDTPDPSVQIVWSFSHGWETATGTTTVNITSIQGTSGNDLLIGTDVADTMEGLAGNDVLSGGGGNDLIEGYEGADTLIGDVGDDTLAGGVGDDVYVVAQAGDVVTELADGGTDLVMSLLADYTLGVNVENGSIASALAVNLTGNELDNVLVAGLGNNVLDGQGGNDTVSYAGALSGVGVALAETGAQATGGSGSDTLLGIENLVGSDFSDDLYGSNGANRIEGGAGDDTIDGLGGADTLDGGAGDDVLDGDNGADTASYAGALTGVAVDLASTGAQNTLGAGSDTILDIENLVGSDFNDMLRGDGGDNRIEGGAGNDSITGLDGADTLVGGAGNDTYTVADADVIVAESADGGIDTVASSLASYVLGSDVENGVILRGDGAALTGNDGANVLQAATGNDTLDGGAGSDTADYASGVGAGVQVNLAAQLATGGSGTDTVLRIENLVGSSFGDQLTGTTGVNRIAGGAGDDTIDGGAGADVMLGGTGNDSFMVRDAGDVVTEFAGGGGADLVNSYLASYVLGSGVENGRIRSADGAQLTGNGIANVLHAGTGNDTLNGGAASDTVAYTYGTTSAVQVNLATQQVTGGSGTDTLASIENVTGSAYGDLLQGSTGSNRLAGANGADTIVGGGGADVLVGGVGNDLLTGGTGADIFRIETTLSSSYNTDTITDFVSGTDTIALDPMVFLGLETGSLAEGGFRASATGTALDADDRIVYNSTTGALSFDADGSGSGAAVRFAILATAPTLAVGDFIVG